MQTGMNRLRYKNVMNTSAGLGHLKVNHEGDLHSSDRSHITEIDLLLQFKHLGQMLQFLLSLTNWEKKKLAATLEDLMVI